VGRTRGSETSQYPEEKKTKPCASHKVIPLVVASEKGRAQTHLVLRTRLGVEGQKRSSSKLAGWQLVH